MRWERNNRFDSGHWRSVRENQQDRQQQARDRRSEANTEYLADEANN